MSALPPAAGLHDLVAELRERLSVVRRGGSESSRRRHTDRGKLLVRDRVDRLLDPGSPFLELSPLAAYDMYGGGVPSAGVVTGIGRVSGREVVVVANDATVKGGTYYPMTVHRSQGSQFDEVTVLLPEPDSRILTRELVYTAVTRARSTVRVVGSEDAIRAAVTRRAQRATGLATRLGPSL